MWQELGVHNDTSILMHIYMKSSNVMLLKLRINQICTTAVARYLSRKWLVWMIVSHMLQPCTRLGECLVAVVTLVRANTSMSADVANQGELNCEGLATDVTLVRA